MNKKDVKRIDERMNRLYKSVRDHANETDGRLKHIDENILISFKALS